MSKFLHADADAGDDDADDDVNNERAMTIMLHSALWHVHVLLN